MPESNSEHDARDFRRLLRFLTRAGPAFGLALAVYRDSAAAEHIAQELSARVIADGSMVRTLHLTRQDRRADLVDRMVGYAKGVDALLVTGFEQLLLDEHGNPRTSPAVGNLNQRRDTLPDELDARVVFWVSETSYPAFRDEAWDLHEVMLTTVHFRTQPLPAPRESPRALSRPVGGIATPKRRPGETATLSRIASTATSRATRADALATAARVHTENAEFDDALVAAAAAAESYEMLGNHRSAAQQRLLCADILRGDQRYDQALAHSKPALFAAQQSEDHALVFKVLETTAGILEDSGDIEAALAVRNKEQLSLARSLDDQALIADTLIGTARVHARAGNHDAANRIFTEDLLPLAKESTPEVAARVGYAALMLGLQNPRGSTQYNHHYTDAREQKLADALAETFREAWQAHQLLKRVDFPHELLPAFDSSGAFWTRVLELYRRGFVSNLPMLACEASIIYPGNDTFRAYCAGP